MLEVRPGQGAPVLAPDGEAHMDRLRALRRHRQDARVPVPEAAEEGRLKLYTSYWSCPILRHVDAVKVSISRGQPKWPVGFKYRRAMLLAPSRETFALKSDEAFEREYLRELEEAGVEKIRDLLRRFSEEAGGRPLVLLCWERHRAECHREMFSRWWFEQTGEAVEELESCGPLHHRQDPQERLFD